MFLPFKQGSQIYILIQFRLIEGRDVETGEEAEVDLLVSYLNGEDVKVKTPAVLHNIENIFKIKVNTDKYYQIELNNIHTSTKSKKKFDY
jgi:hypothetical protein